jgi:hypothetical protein
MGAILYEKAGGAPHPPGTEELFIGPGKVRVLVHSAEEKQFWREAHERECAAAGQPITDVDTGEVPAPEPEPAPVEPPAVETPAEPELETPTESETLSEPEPTHHKRRRR